MLVALDGLPATRPAETQPIQLLPANPHYFLWRGRPTVLIGSGEHYGMVLNAELNPRRYLDTLQTDGLNYTRLFSGAYVEKPGAFGIERNNLAPAAGRFLAPWMRSATPGYAGGGNKFDLTRWNPEYFARLSEFISEAARRGIVVELTLFSSIYNDDQWSVNAFNPTNNVNQIRLTDWRRLHTRTNDGVLFHQEALVRQLVRAVNGHDNLIFEIQNEPWSDHHTMGELLNPYLTDRTEFPNAVELTTADAVEWQKLVATWITSTEAALPRRHLLAQNVANFRLPVRPADLAPAVSIVNFHYAFPEAATWNLGLGKVIGYDETGFAGRADDTYRREAWHFVMAGGGLFNHLDYSFTAGHEDGSDTGSNGPGGGSPALRRQFRVLAEFIHGFDLSNLRPDHYAVRKSPGAMVRTLSQPGVAYALYLQGRSPCQLELELPAGNYRTEWVDVRSGRIAKAEPLVHRGGPIALVSPEFDGEVALRILRVGR